YAFVFNLRDQFRQGRLGIHQGGLRMSLDRQFNPVTMDYVDGEAGTFAEVDVLDNQIVFSEVIELGHWEGDKELGSLFHQIRERDTAETRTKIKEAGVHALD